MGQEVELHQMHIYFDLGILGMQTPDQRMNCLCQDNLTCKYKLNVIPHDREHKHTNFIGVQIMKTILHN